MMNGEFWRAQALNELLPLWYEHVRDLEHGGFYLNLSRDWQPRPPWEKASPMLGRQVYTFSAGYLLSGEDKYLHAARSGAYYLLEHAWDQDHGGWFDRLAATGEAALTTKSVPEQLYTNVGLTQYYFTTGDEKVLSHVNRANEIRRTCARDAEFGGYYQVLNRDLSVRDEGKNKHSHYGYVGSLLLNLFLTTRDPEVLALERELSDLTLERMRDSEGWVHGWPDSFDRRWRLTPAVERGAEIVAIGAQLTASISLLRLYYQTGEERYWREGKGIADLATQWGFNPESGAWVDFVNAKPPHNAIEVMPSGPAGDYRGPGAPPDGTPTVSWWVQIYGAFLQLQLFNRTRDDRYLVNFETAEKFFLAHFIDREHGGVFGTVSGAGALVGDGRKASDWHASYHEIEHCLLNYLYLNLYVAREAAVLHFKLNGTGPRKVHYVSLLDDTSIGISGVKIDGKSWTAFNARERSVTLPDRDNLHVEVTLAPA
jgi:cellobiose epimerase